MNKKKRMTMLGLSAVLVFSLFTGCNSTSTANSGNETTQPSVQAQEESDVLVIAKQGIGGYYSDNRRNL